MKQITSICIRRSPSRKKKITLLAVIVSISYYYLVFTTKNNTPRDLHSDVLLRYIEAPKIHEEGLGCIVPRLDPFDKELAQYDKDMPPIKCSGQDWVKCNYSKCNVIQSIIDEMDNIRCVYRDVMFDDDYKFSLGSPRTVKGTENYKLGKSDHVKVKCTGIKNGLSSTWSGYTLGLREVKPNKLTSYTNNISILIVCIDSTSKNGFIRRMPESYKALRDLGAVVLDGYNIVEGGTPGALLPVLTGKRESEFPYIKRSTFNKKRLDSMPFLFNVLKDIGYRTAYFEDSPICGTFQYRFNGFRNQPTDHYMRTFFLAVDEEKYFMMFAKLGSLFFNYNGDYCVGDTPQYALILNTIKQFLSLDSKKFCFTLIGDISHDDFNMASAADHGLANFLKEFKNNNHLKDTLLFVMGDHGPRYSKIRDTFIGRREERLPLMAIVLPTKLMSENPQALDNLRANADVLTTPYDIHATILDAIGLHQGTSAFKVPGSNIPRSLSLLRRVPSARTCIDAGIGAHWCSCLKWENISRDDAIYSKASVALVDHINSLTQDLRSMCAVRTLSLVEWVMRLSGSRQILPLQDVNVDGLDSAGNKEYIEVKIVVGPARAVYEACMEYSIQEGEFEIAGEISRTNAYGEEGKCIRDSHPNLYPYCYCKRR